MNPSRSRAPPPIEPNDDDFSLQLELVIGYLPKPGRAGATRLFMLFTWLHVPALAALAWGCGGLVVPAVGVMTIVAACASLVALRAGDDANVRIIAAVGITLGGIPFALLKALTQTAAGPPEIFACAEGIALDALAFLLVAHGTLSRSRRTAEVARLATDLAAQRSELQAIAADRERLAHERDDATLRLDAVAHHDEITGLPNRRLLMERLSGAIASQAAVVVLYLDLSDLKAVNETTGHASGDRALAIIAARIGRCIRSADIASRVGGDEFVIVCTSSEAPPEGSRIAERLIAAISEPIQAGHARMRLGSNIGISIARSDGDDPDELVHAAQAAMYRAKARGVNCFHVDEPESYAEMFERPVLRG